MIGAMLVMVPSASLALFLPPMPSMPPAELLIRLIRNQMSAKKMRKGTTELSK